MYSFYCLFYDPWMEDNKEIWKKCRYSQSINEDQINFNILHSVSITCFSLSKEKNEA